MRDSSGTLLTTRSVHIVVTYPHMMAYIPFHDTAPNNTSYTIICRIRSDECLSFLYQHVVMNAAHVYIWSPDLFEAPTLGHRVLYVFSSQ
jgi:hypothetical protein